MVAGVGEGHWLDRLAVRHTRRHAFKATLAAAAITLPLVRTGRARAAEDLHACQKGCLYASHRHARGAFEKCQKNAPLRGPLIETLFLGQGIYGGAKVVALGVAVAACYDTALLYQKERNELCAVNGCPGFNPYDEWGPCKNCATINGCQCCPDPSAPTGYTYCSSLSNYCCSPNGGCRVCGT
jgi:hypothetical protein